MAMTRYRARRKRSRQRRFRQPITEMVNETFGRLPQIRPVFDEKLPQSDESRRNFEAL